ncbi:putative leucine-rich repeats protein [Candidatus Cyrtobacter comes]|uniref:Leucine-rich repeats protein n=1 Tax=Candidatus Cyrtobacter comes TaxID=675776 RepID=A0ABU5L9P0_9RICK|nr:hypothetical protein [Candidatus Cyrtobacter comes]MDZ5762841.1 putative leucine-rich repeats protein [Candidatus Cyrtobacter comes]
MPRDLPDINLVSDADKLNDENVNKSVVAEDLPGVDLQNDAEPSGACNFAFADIYNHDDNSFELRDDSVKVFDFKGFMLAFDRNLLSEVQSIDISNIPITSRDMWHLAHSICSILQFEGKIENLKLSNAKISDDVLSCLSWFFNNLLYGVESLDLSSNLITSGGFRVLAYALSSQYMSAPHISGIRSVYVGGNQIWDNGWLVGPFGGSPFMSGVSSVLRVLNMSSNQLVDSALINFVEVLNNNKGAFSNLEIFDLHNNKIGDRGAWSLNDAIDFGVLLSLTYVDLSENDGISSDTLKHTAKLTSSNRAHNVGINERSWYTEDDISILLHNYFAGDAYFIIAQTQIENYGLLAANIRHC